MKNLPIVLVAIATLAGGALAMSSCAKAGAASPANGSVYYSPHQREPWFRDDPWMDGDRWYRDASSASVGVYFLPPRHLGGKNP